MYITESSKVKTAMRQPIRPDFENRNDLTKPDPLEGSFFKIA